MKNTFFILLVLFVVSCNTSKEESVKSREISRLGIKDILTDSTLSIRSIEVINNDVYYAERNGNVGIVLENGPYVQDKYRYDSINPSFRSAAFNGNSLFYLSIGSPALLYKIDRDEVVDVYISSNLVYEEHHEKAFYDAMDFWNDKEGIAIGDPTDGCMSIIITRDGGNTWNKLSCDNLPKTKEGEAAFAASDTNIAIVGDKTWVATGGKASRVLYSLDKGHTWSIVETPITQGQETTGMYSIDFYDANTGYAIGGDYLEPKNKTANKIRTTDGGKTWTIVGANQEPGYRSCVQYIPKREGKELVAVGFNGIDYSNDSGTTWKHLSDEGFYTIRFVNDSIAYAAGKGRISKVTFRE